MKCPCCVSLVCDSDTICACCGTSLMPARRRAARERAIAETSPWAYLFAAMCGIIPVVSLGGAIPVAVGLGGAFACLGVARADGVSCSLRFVVGLAITAACWAVVLTLAVEMHPHVRYNLEKLLHG